MWTLSGFVDEISDDFTEQCKVASGLGLRHVEVRSAWQTNILDLDNGQLDTLRETLAEYGLPRRCLDIVTSLSVPQLLLAWDPANFVQVGVRPFAAGYAMLRPYVGYIQIKDALLEDGSVVVAGAGDGEVVETIRALREDGFDGFLSLEPHLDDTTSAGAFSGPELFTQAWEALTNLLNREGIPYA